MRQLYSLFYLRSFVGAAAAGPCTVTGGAVGINDQLMAVFGSPTAGGALTAYQPGTDFEQRASVANQIQQLSASNLSASTFIAMFIPST